VQNYVFNFSFERLSDLIEDPIMVMLFYHMMGVKADSPDIIKCRLRSLAEHQASLRIIEHSCFGEKIAPAYKNDIV
jgi:hypothetical protein